MPSTTHRRAAQVASALLRQTAKPTSFASFSTSAAAAARRSIAGATHTPWRTSSVCRAAFSSQAGALPTSRSSVLAARRAYSTDAADHKLWSFEELQKLTKKADSKVVIVDTREPGELQDTGRIPGAINIPVSSSPDSFFLPDEDFEDRFGFARPSQDTEVVFYCKAGVRSRAAAALAKQAGWTKVGEYPGSWLDWSGNGGEVER